MQQRGDKQDTIERRLKESGSWDKQAKRSEIPYIFISNNGTIEEAVNLINNYLK